MHTHTHTHQLAHCAPICVTHRAVLVPSVSFLTLYVQPTQIIFKETTEHPALRRSHASLGSLRCPRAQSTMLCLLRLRYPIWLTENKSKISAEQYTNYTNQFELMKKMCGGINMFSLNLHS